MPKKQNELYSVDKTTFWFAVASIILTITLILIVFQDHNREWKKWQKQFVALEREKVEAELAQAQAGVDQAKLAALEEELKAAKAELKQNKAQVKAAQSERAAIDLKQVKANTRYQDLKQHYDSYKFFFEEYQEHGEEAKATDYESKLVKTGAKLEAARVGKEEAELELETADAQLAAFETEEKRLQKEIDALLNDQTRVQRTLNNVKPSIVKDVLNAPMVDFIAPSLQVQQVVLEDLHDDFYFAKAQVVDRCTTCHLGIDRKGFEDAPQPFTTHPNLDLFLGSKSPHQLEKIGCTTCHGGSGQSLSFTWAAHTPQNEAQAEQWKKDYGWHELHKWEAKMLPLQHAEASCTKCHQGVVNVPGAPKLNEGRSLAREYGCFGCHAAKGFENQWKAGPDLRNVMSKLEREWIVRWLQDPRVFRPSTRMPRIFHLENTDSEEDRRKSNVAIEGIASYLLKNSGTVELAKPKAKGDPEIGKQLIGEVGCLGCHSADGKDVNNHGPELVYMGSKVGADWLYTWLKNPRHYSPETRMPNMRLSDEEAVHITSYLLAQRNDAFDGMTIPPVTEGDLDALALDYMMQKKRKSEALEELAGMELEAKYEFVGQKMILQQGCFGCHAIKGFEDAKPIGTEITKEGEKEVDKLDFGFVDIPHARKDWFFQKLKNPRIFDRGKIKGYHEKLRMPDFSFTDEQSQALTTFLLSQTVEDIPLEMQRKLDLKEAEVEIGRLLVAKFNCQGCHTLDGVEGRARSLFEDEGNAPPIIDGEGAKVQEGWLYHFLQEPETIRPWLTYRMPTFGFSKEETDQLVQYFSNLDDQEISFAVERIGGDRDMIAHGEKLFGMLQCIKCHQPGAATVGLSASFLAPELEMTKRRLKPGWVVEWIRDPQELQEGTMMPGFFPDGETPVPDILGGEALKQMEAIRDYLWTYSPQEGDGS